MSTLENRQFVRYEGSDSSYAALHPSVPDFVVRPRKRNLPPNFDRWLPKKFLTLSSEVTAISFHKMASDNLIFDGTWQAMLI